jgi:hypothetical protein
MRRSTEKQIAGALKQWSKLRARKERIEAERDQTINPIRTRFEQRCAPIHLRAQAKLDPVEQQMKQFEDEITSLMSAGISEDGQIAFTRVDTATAVAEVVTRTEREIDAKTFFENVPVSQRSTAFWSCLKTLIGKAEKFLGADRVNELAHAKRNHIISIQAK